MVLAKMKNYEDSKGNNMKEYEQREGRKLMYLMCIVNYCWFSFACSFSKSENAGVRHECTLFLSSLQHTIQSLPLRQKSKKTAFAIKQECFEIIVSMHTIYSELNLL